MIPTTRFIRPVASAVGLIGVLIGVPLALVHFVAPVSLGTIARVMEHPRGFPHVLSRPLTGSAVAGAAACVAWATWGWFVACMAVELIARARGRHPIRLPGSSRFQVLVAMLVGALITLLPATRPAQSVRLVPVATAATTLLADQIGGVMETRSAAEPLSKGTDPEPAPTGRYTVVPGDTLWSIAEHQLDDPLRWREIADLNRGRAQSDGRSLTDEHWILPGWVLVLPIDGPPIPSPVSALVPEAGPDPAPPAPSPPALAGLRPLAAEVASSGAPAHIHLDGSTRASVQERRREGIPVGPIGYGILGAGIVTLLERLRRVQRRHRPTGLRIALPEADLAGLEQRIRMDADDDAANVGRPGDACAVGRFAACGFGASAGRLGAHYRSVAGGHRPWLGAGSPAVAAVPTGIAARRVGPSSDCRRCCGSPTRRRGRRG